MSHFNTRKPACLVICTLLASAVQSSLSRHIVHVDENNGDDSTNCIEGNGSCRTLNYAVKGTTSNTNYILSSSLITIDTEIEFMQRHEISIFGNPLNITRVQCNCSEKAMHCGLIFNKSSNIALLDFEVHKCSVNVLLGKDLHRLSTAVIFLACQEINLTRIGIFHSPGSAVSVINSFGNIGFYESRFIGSFQHPQNDYYGGGGVLIAFHAKFLFPTTNHGVYNISKCNFTDNVIRTTPAYYLYHLSYGGGLNIYLRFKAMNNFFCVDRCIFKNNTALGGGGLAVSIQNGASNNAIRIQNCTFTLNNGSYDSFGGGGGMKISINSGGMLKYVSNNAVNLMYCQFEMNNARFGGGTVVLAGKIGDFRNINQVYFTNCHWKQNKASVSAAVDIAPDAYSQDGSCFNTQVHFKNCSFSFNYLSPFRKDDKTKMKGHGVVAMTKLSVALSGVIILKNNSGSALFLHSSYIDVHSQSIIEFHSNKASDGGAIRMIGFSGIHYENSVMFRFIDNHASFLGGAIFSINSDHHQLFSSYTCLFRPLKIPAEDVFFDFENNTAGANFGNSIYIASLHPCETNNTLWKHHPFSDLGNFTFSNTTGHAITTDVNRLYVDNENSQKVTPGFFEHIPYHAEDDIGNDITSIFSYVVNLYNHSGNASIDMRTKIINDNRIIIRGKPGGGGTLYVEPIASRGLYILIHLELNHCPPGFILEQDVCICSANQLREAKRYKGINGCINLTALLSPGHWAGYILHDNDSESEKTLFTSNCPLNYCKPLFKQSKSVVFEATFLQLPLHPNKSEMEKLICSENRHGTLCGRCEGGTAVFFHSNTYHCKKEQYCYFGFLIYILAELLPIVVLFSVILIFDISLTSGTAFSIIFMMQQFHVLEITALDALDHPLFVYMLEGSNLIYGFVNMEMFNIDFLSFCLWPNAQTLDIIFTKYASIGFAIGLLSLFIFFTNKCNCRCKIICMKQQNRHLSIAKGLSSVLVLCYTKLSAITFSILDFEAAYGLGKKMLYNVAFLDGDSKYFQDDHLKYALPALFFLIFIVIPPPLLLIVDPLLLKLEDRFCYYKQPWTTVRIRFKPFLDAFQHCFKDNLRCFAGFFFLYRFVIQMLHLLSPDTIHYYYLLELFFIVILTVHSIKHPFLKPKDNVIASLCFLNLALVNLSSIIIQRLMNNGSSVKRIQFFQCLQLLLIYCPLLIVIGWVMITRKGCLKRQLKHSGNVIDSISIVFDRRRPTTSSYGSVSSVRNHTMYDDTNTI